MSAVGTRHTVRVGDASDQRGCAQLFTLNAVAAHLKRQISHPHVNAAVRCTSSLGVRRERESKPLVHRTFVCTSSFNVREPARVSLLLRCMSVLERRTFKTVHKFYIDSRHSTSLLLSFRSLPRGRSPLPAMAPACALLACLCSDVGAPPSAVDDASLSDD